MNKPTAWKVIFERSKNQEVVVLAKTKAEAYDKAVAAIKGMPTGPWYPVGDDTEEAVQPVTLALD